MIMTYAAKENLEFEVALECLVLEGVKGVCEHSPDHCPAVYKSVQNPVKKPVH